MPSRFISIGLCMQDYSTVSVQGLRFVRFLVNIQTDIYTDRQRFGQFIWIAQPAELKIRSYWWRRRWKGKRTTMNLSICSLVNENRSADLRAESGSTADCNFVRFAHLGYLHHPGNKIDEASIRIQRLKHYGATSLKHLTMRRIARE